MVLGSRVLGEGVGAAVERAGPGEGVGGGVVLAAEDARAVGEVVSARGTTWRCRR